ncbi:hypothetical protein [Synechococcus phage S-H34]|uniref:Uncharacterized protein n=1 Tax=Synechococcus phage S-H34 TaxID=2718942 RepID=A0A6H2HSR6_9CAUD|nr:tail collar protein [Synechococcus phage S-H34]QJC69100.1 hypothetical protein [Synechococcus phage S-H34]
MAAINFPSSPTQGQSYTENGQTWYYDGVKWVSGGTFGQSALTPMYQQGTWAPTLTLGSATVYENRWTRIGNQVTVYCALGSFTDTTSNAAIAVEGMPYQVTGKAVGSAIVNKAVTSNNVQVDHVYIESETTLQFINSGANDTDNWRNLLHSGMGSNNCDIWFTITYITNDTTWAPAAGATVS